MKKNRLASRVSRSLGAAVLTVVASCAIALPALASGPLVANEAHALMLAGNKTVCAVGENYYGQLGDGTNGDRNSPVTAAALANVVGISTGWTHSLAVLSDGTVWAWGYNANGELGDGTTISRDTPMTVPGLTGMIAVAASQYHSLALKNDGTVWAWGYNSSGRLGDGTTTERHSPVQVINLTGVTAIAAGQSHSMALKSDGTLWGWGYNGYGQLGVGNTTDSANAVQVVGLSTVSSIVAGENYSMALKADGTLWAWGYNGYGQLGNGNTASQSSIVRVTGLTNVVGFAGSEYHSIAVLGDGTVWTWGYNGNGELGDGTTTQRITPVQVTSVTGASAVAAGTVFSEALKSDGSMWAWGLNTNGQLGTGNNTASIIPVASQTCASGIYTGAGTSALMGRLSASQNHSVAIKSDNTVWGWGDNTNGELGDGTTISRSTPVQAVGVSGATVVSAGWYHTLAIAGGAVWSWGYNGNGELGDGTTSNRSTPLAISGLSGYTSVSAGQYHSMALKNDGTVWTWGYNTNGRLGDGTSTQRLSAVKVINLTGAIAIAAGQSHSMALKSDGTVWTWGYNGYGQLGNGSYTDSATAVQVSGLTGVVAIAAGANYSMAIKSDGTLWTWGVASNGQLGDGGTGYSYQPEIVRASGLTGIVAIAGGVYHSLAVKSDGTVWSFGYNSDGELGDGSVVQRPAPVQVTGLTTAQGVAAGVAHSFAIMADGSIWAWGSNSVGQFGEASPASSTVPVESVTSGFGASVIASMMSPVPGTTFTGSSVTFTWNNTNAPAYWLDVGTVQGQGNIFGQNVGTSLTQTVTGIPTTGQTIYVKLWSLINGTWQGNAYTYTAATIATATMQSPVNGSTLAGSSVTFTWNSVAATAYWLDVGTVLGQGNIFGQNVGTSTSQLVTGIPTAGQPLYVKLWSLINGTWQSNSYTYTENAGVQPAVMASPTPGSVLSGSTITFTWNNAGASAYWLDVGTIQGQGNIFGQNVGTVTSQQVTGIPTSGQPLYVKLWSLINGMWQANTYTYTESSGVQPAVIQSPAPSSTLTGSSVTFSWLSVGATAYWLDVGTVAGQGNIFGQNVGTSVSQTVTGIPTTSQTIYVRLWSLINGTWLYNSYTYTAASPGKAAMQTPTQGSTLSGSSVTFTWNSVGATAYWLDVGTVVGQGNIFGQNVGTNTSQAVTGIPTNGLPVYVRLWSLISGTWVYNAYTYTAAGASSPAVLTGPTPGTVLGGSTVTFSWVSTGASAYWLDVGTVFGQGNIFGQNVGTNTSQTVSGIPTSGQVIYVRLWSLISGTWQYNAYTYTAAGSGVLATMQSPANGSTLPGATVTFSWNNTGAAAYWLDVGTTVGQGNIYGQSVGTNTSQTVTGIPTTGQPIYVKLWSLFNGVWQGNTYTYTSF